MALLCVIPALVMAQSGGIRVAKTSHNSIKLTWSRVQGGAPYRISYQAGHTGGEIPAGSTSRNSYTISGLKPYTLYTIWVAYNGGFYQTSARTTTKFDPTAVPTTMPVQSTCPSLPSTVALSGLSFMTQCQMVDGAILGVADVINRGIISAVDLWYFVPENTEVCIRGDGWLVLLDADYAPRMAMELEHYHRAGMTCGVIDREGTVVLLASPPADAPHHRHDNQPVEQPAEQPREETSAPALPVFESIPLVDCQIKLVETLFMRAAGRRDHRHRLDEFRGARL